MITFNHRFIHKHMVVWFK